MFNEICKKLLNGKIKSIDRSLDLVSFSILPEASNIEIGLHIQCFFRVLKNKKVIMTHSDIFSVGSKCKNAENFRFSRPYETLFDDCREKWMTDISEAKILNISNSNNDLYIKLENDFFIEILIDSITEEEKYRLFEDLDNSQHYVVYSNSNGLGDGRLRNNKAL